MPCDTIDRYPDLKPPAQFLTDFKQAFGGEAGWGSGSVWVLGFGVCGLGYRVSDDVVLDKPFFDGAAPGPIDVSMCAL